MTSASNELLQQELEYTLSVTAGELEYTLIVIAGEIQKCNLAVRTF